MSGPEKQARDCDNGVTFKLPLPPSVNALYKNVPGRGRAKTTAYKKWITSAGWELLAQRPGRLLGPYTIKISLHRPDNRRRDAENYIKAVSDLLVRHGVVEDDSRAVSTTVAWDGREHGIATVVLTPSPNRD